MYNFLTKHGTGAAFGLGLLVSILGLAVVVSGLEGFNNLSKEQQGTTSIFNVVLMGTFILMNAAIALVVLFGIRDLVEYPKNAIKFLVGVGAIILLGFLFYSLSTVETSGKVFEQIRDGRLNEGVSKILNGALWTTFILAVIAILGIVASEVRNLIK